jgi:hypothetical protein
MSLFVKELKMNLKINQSLALRERLVRARRPLYGDNERGVLVLCWIVPYTIWVCVTGVLVWCWVVPYIVWGCITARRRWF